LPTAKRRARRFAADTTLAAECPGGSRRRISRDTAKQIRQILLLLQESGFTLPIILTSIDRYGSVMLAEYTTVHGKKDHWDCEIIAEHMKSELFEPPINMLFVNARGEAARVVFDAAGERRILH
jgi:hypothetical protein